MPSFHSLLVSRYISVDGETSVASTPSIGLIIGLLVLSICLCLSAWCFHIWVKRRRVQRLSKALPISRDVTAGQYHELSLQRQHNNWGWGGANAAGGWGRDAELHSGTLPEVSLGRVAPPAYVG